VVEIGSRHGLATGTVDFGGLRKEVCLAYVPEAAVGDYVIVHVGFAISVIDRRRHCVPWSEQLPRIC